MNRNRFIITNKKEIVNDNTLMRIASRLLKEFEVTEIWEETAEKETGISFKNMFLVLESNKIVLEIKHESMSIDKQIEIYKDCLDEVYLLLGRI